MSKNLPKAVPQSFRRIVLLNPTRYLGNLVIAGHLMQDFLKYCQHQGIEFLIVVDEIYRPILSPSFPEQNLLYYPRSLLNKGPNPWHRIRAYLDFFRQLRSFNADIAFNIEEDTTSNRLTLWSGAGFKLGSNPLRNKSGYDYVIPAVFYQKSGQQRHRWNGYREVFELLYPATDKPCYLQIPPDRDFQLPVSLEFQHPGKTIAIHSGATKEYKKWPIEYFCKFANMLIAAGYNLVLIGAGQADAEANNTLMASLNPALRQTRVIDVCNKLDLYALAQLFARIDGIVGNDSGPFHLAAAMGLKGCVIFGPTDTEMWGPLSDLCQVISGKSVCSPLCTKRYCQYDHACLKSISPELVFDRLEAVMKS